METAAPSTCASLRDALLHQDFLRWSGWDTACAWQEIFPDLTLHEGLAERALGRLRQKGPFIGLLLEGYYRPTLNFRAGEFRMFDAMLPAISETDTQLLVKKLGEPAARLDWYYGTLKMPASEWPFPAQGITLFMRDDAEKILHIALYAPTSLEDYLDGLRPDLQKRR